MTTVAATTSNHIPTATEIAPNIEAKTVAQSISVVFKQCLAKIPLENIQKRSDCYPLNFEFHICVNANSHPCFGSLNYLDIYNAAACTQFLLQVGQELTHIIKPTDYSYRIEVSDFEVSQQEDVVVSIKSYELIIKCFGKQGEEIKSPVYENCGIFIPSDKIYDIYKDFSDKTWVRDNSTVRLM